MTSASFGLRCAAPLLVAVLVAGCHTVESIAPNPAVAGQNVTIDGQGFGTLALFDGVIYDGVFLTLVSWTDTRIVARLPGGKPDGVYPVQVRKAGQYSTVLLHTISQTGGPVVLGATLTPNPSNHLSATVEFETSSTATPTVVVSSSVQTFTVPASGVLSGVPGTTHRVAVVGLRPERHHDVAITAKDGNGLAGAPVALSYTPGPVPPGFPPLDLTVRVPGQFAPGLTVFGMTRGIVAADTGIYVVDDAGELIWYYRRPVDIFTHVAQLANGNFLAMNQNGLVGEIDLLGNVVGAWLSDRGGMLHHDVAELPNGNLLALDTEMRTVCCYPDGPFHNLVGDVIVERSRTTGATVWQLELLDLLDPYRIANKQLFDAALYDFLYGVPTKDWSHANGLHYDASDDSVVVSLRSQNTTIKVSRATRQLVWVVGEDLPTTAGDDDWPFLALTGPGELPHYLHGPSLAANGHLYCYDNGNEKPVEYTRAVEYALAPGNGTMQQVWEYVDPDYDPPLFAPWVGDVDPLPGGTVLIADGGVYDPELLYLRWAKLTEVRRSDKQKVWELKVRDPADLEGFQGYDAQRIQSLYPPVS